MEILFENSYIRNKEWAKAVYGYITFCRPFMIACNVYFVLYIVFAVVRLIIFRDIDMYLMYSFILPIIFVFSQVCAYAQNIKITLNRDLEAHGKHIEVRTSATDECLTIVQSTGSETRLNYADVKKAIQIKKYIFLQTKTKLLYTFKKDGFSVGKEEDFLEFLRNKGVKTGKR